MYANCPKYISTRKPEPDALDRGSPAPAAHGTRLEAAQRDLLRKADSLAIVSAHAVHGADVSHRGGRPGFVVVSADGHHVTRPDYRDNAMFMTLGNLDIDPAAAPISRLGDRRPAPSPGTRARRRDSRTDRSLPAC